ncbi:hypothetical protein BH10PSE7_BH10PSE7_35590 [soil metagenome]
MTDFYLTGQDASDTNAYFIFDGSDWVNPPALPGLSDRVFMTQMKSGSLNVDSLAGFNGNLLNPVFGAAVIRGGTVIANAAPEGITAGEIGGSAMPSITINGNISNGAFAANASINAVSIDGSVTASTGGVISVSGAITAEGGTVTAAGGSVNVDGAIIAQAVRTLDGSIRAASIHNNGDVGMMNRIEGGTLQTGNYNIVSTAGLTDTLEILDGGVATITGQLGLGRLEGDNGSLTIGGAGSRLVFGSTLTAGDAGQATLIIRDGAIENLTGLVLGKQTSGVGFLQVLSAARLSIADDLTLGDFGNGQALISDAKLTVKGDLDLAVNASTTGIVSGTDGDVLVQGKLIFGLGNASVVSEDVAVGVGTSVLETGALHLGAAGLLRVGQAGHADSHGLISGDLSNDAAVSKPGVDIRGGTLTITGDLRGDGLIKVGNKATLELHGSEDASVETSKGAASLNILHDDSNNDIFDYQSDKFSHFDLGASQFIDGGTEDENSAVNHGRDLLKLPGKPADYRITTFVEATWHNTVSTIRHYGPNEAAVTNPLHSIGTNDVEKVEFANPTVTNVVKPTAGSTYAELAWLAGESYGKNGDAKALEHVYAHNWRPLSAIELGIKPSDYGEGPIKYTYEKAIYHGKQPFFWSPGSEAMPVTGVLDGKTTLVIAFRGTDEGLLRESPSFVSMQATFEKDFGVLIDALKTYISDYDIDRVLVTGHSLGSAMTQSMLLEGDFQDSKYTGVGFASPGAEKTAPAADQMCNFIHTGDAIRITVGGGKHVAGPIVWLNSVHAKGDAVQQHEMSTYISDMKDLAVLARDAGSPFFTSALAAALRSGDHYDGATLGIAPGTSRDDVIDCAPRKSDFDLTVSTDRYVLGGAGNDDIQVNTAFALGSRTGRTIDGGGNIDTLELRFWKSSHFDLVKSKDGSHFRLTYEGNFVADLYRVEEIRFADKLVRTSGAHVSVQTPGASGATFNLSTSFDYADAGNADNLTIAGTKSGDLLYIGHGRKTAALGDGDDSVIAKILNPGQGSDNVVLEGQNGNDFLTSGIGKDKLFGGAGNDSLDGGDGSDRLAGGAGDDTYTVRNSGDIVIEGHRAGSDRVNASVTFTLAANVEYLSLDEAAGAIGGTGNGLANQIDGNSARNRIDGGGGGDTLSGGGGGDTIIGGTGADFMYGGTGNDTLAGGAGPDIMTGNAGSDIFDFNVVSDSPFAAKSRDSILDFLKGADRIDLHGIDAKTTPPGNQDFTFIGTDGFTAGGQVRIAVSDGHTIVQINTAGASGGEMAIDLSGVYALGAGDFIL